MRTLRGALGATSILHKNAPSFQSKNTTQSGPFSATQAPPKRPSDVGMGAFIVRCSLKFLKILIRANDSRIAKSPVPTCGTGS